MCEFIQSELTSREDGLKISVMTGKPDQKPRAIVQLVHGMSEHKERYQPFMEYLAKQRFLCVIHDHRGHGGSVEKEEDLGYMYGGGADALLDDILLVNETVKKEYPQLPLILFGHSMGSLAVRAFTKEHENCINALIVCGSPANNPGRPLGTLLARGAKAIFGGRHVCRFIETISFGSYAAKFSKEKNRFAWVCSDKQVVDAYAASPLCGFTFTADAYLVLFELMKRAYSRKKWNVDKTDMPILFVGGADDPCIGGKMNFARAIYRMKQVGYHNVKGKLYPGMRHEILNEREKETVFEEISRYLRKQGF